MADSILPFSFSPSPSSATAASHALALPLESANALPASPASQPSSKRRRRWWWLQRDSLARRLFIGKPGSRRRQRFDNNHFTDHPFASTDADFIHEWDQEPGFILPAKPTIFSEVTFSSSRKSLINVSPNEVVRPHVQTSSVPPSPPPSPVCGPSNLSRADRDVRRTVRRSCCDDDLVRKLELVIVNFITDSLGIAKHSQIHRIPSIQTMAPRSSIDSVNSNDSWDYADSISSNDDWVLLDTPASAQQHEIQLEIKNGFLRLLIHMMCRYYLMESESIENAAGTRVTVIRNPFAQENAKRSPSDYSLPDITFAEFLLG
eukprot:jgi/Hompol1/6255/HPOL_002197-RA